MKWCLFITSSNLFTGLGAAWKVADVSKGSTVAIFGLGTVGLSVSMCSVTSSVSNEYRHAVFSVHINNFLISIFNLLRLHKVQR